MLHHLKHETNPVLKVMMKKLQPKKQQFFRSIVVSHNLFFLDLFGLLKIYFEKSVNCT